VVLKGWQRRAGCFHAHQLVDDLAPERFAASDLVGQVRRAIARDLDRPDTTVWRARDL